MKYVILANSNDKTFKIPRQLVKINGEPLVERTIRLLKENGVEDILITASDERFKNFGVEVYSPKSSDYDYKTEKGYWLNAFPFELLEEPICFIWGDVYFSENAIKTIVETPANSTLFFCTFENESPLYIKKHDEPLAYKVVDTDLFKRGIEETKRLFDEGVTWRHPIVWELYRVIHGQNVNAHEMTTDYVAINDISCDIDGLKDIEKLKEKVEKYMIKVEVIEEFTLKDFAKLKNIIRANPKEAEILDKGKKLKANDIFECTEEMCDYLTGNNPIKKAVVKVIEIIPEEKAKIEKKPTTKKTSKKTTKAKKNK